MSLALALPIHNKQTIDLCVSDLIVLLLFNDNADFHRLIRERSILSYLTGSFRPSVTEEYSVGLVMTLQQGCHTTQPHEFTTSWSVVSHPLWGDLVSMFSQSRCERKSSEQ